MLKNIIKLNNTFFFLFPGPARGGGDRRGVDDRKAAAPVRRVKKEPDADGWTKL